MQQKWRTIRDCLSGQDAIKTATTAYLPKPNPSDQSSENSARYNQYIERAVFYNVTQRTHSGLVGQVFRRAPVLKCGNRVKMLNNDIDGAGVTLDQQAKKALGDVLAFGRCGLFADFPATDKVSLLDIEQGYANPTITLYSPWDIINWRTKKVGSRNLLSLVVLQENYAAEDDGFEVKTSKQWRVLSLTEDNIFKVEIWRNAEDGARTVDTFYPRNSVGNNLTEIPFVFVGSVNNDSTIDLPPLYDMAVLNIAHYRNSADYEEAAYIVGQPTPYFSGLTREWVEDVFKKKAIELGCRAAVPLPEAGKAGLLQAAPNTMPKEAMELKEKQMISLGAKLVEQSTVQRTATEARQEEASESSILSSCAVNISHAYTKALNICAQFVGESEDCEYSLNTDFDLSRLSAAEIQQVVANWLSGAMSWAEVRTCLRKVGLVSQDDELAKADIQKEQAEMIKLETKNKETNNGDQSSNR
jgi:hypothetical protein